MYTTKTKSMKMMFKKLLSLFKRFEMDHGMLVNTNISIDLRVIRNVKD